MIRPAQVVIWLASVESLCQDSAACAAVMAACGPSARDTPAFIAGRRLLAKAAGLDALRSLTTSAQGKPRFQAQSLPAFSISHSGDVIGLALADKAEIGLDIEVYRPRSRHRIVTLAERWFSQEEQERLAADDADNDNDGIPAVFWQCWTAHEAVIKQQGKTVWQIRPEDTAAAGLAARGLALSALHTPELAISLCAPSGIVADVPQRIAG